MNFPPYRAISPDESDQGEETRSKDVKRAHAGTGGLGLVLHQLGPLRRMPSAVLSSCCVRRGDNQVPFEWSHPRLVPRSLKRISKKDMEVVFHRQGNPKSLT